MYGARLSFSASLVIDKEIPLQELDYSELQKGLLQNIQRLQ
jgi:hypothetical protein